MHLLERSNLLGQIFPKAKEAARPPLLMPLPTRLRYQTDLAERYSRAPRRQCLKCHGDFRVDTHSVFMMVSLPSERKNQVSRWIDHQVPARYIQRRFRFAAAQAGPPTSSGYHLCNERGRRSVLRSKPLDQRLRHRAGPPDFIQRVWVLTRDRQHMGRTIVHACGPDLNARGRCPGGRDSPPKTRGIALPSRQPLAAL
jgi:hypothetical protein